MCTHLKAKKGFEEIRENQSKQLIHKFGKEDQPLIICGDFNDEPASPAIKAMNEAFQSCSQVALAGKEQPFSTYKFRESSGMMKRTIDYVYVNQGKHF